MDGGSAIEKHSLEGFTVTQPKQYNNFWHPSVGVARLSPQELLRVLDIVSGIKRQSMFISLSSFLVENSYSYVLESGMMNSSQPLVM